MRGNIYIDQPFRDKFSYENNKSKKEMGGERVCVNVMLKGVSIAFFRIPYAMLCHAMPCYAMLCYAIIKEEVSESEYLKRVERVP